MSDRTATIEVAVVGAHLAGEPLNYQLVDRQAHLLAATHTAPIYKLYALTGTHPAKPGLMRIDPNQETGYGIEVEVWEMPIVNFGSFVVLIPAPLGIGTITLESGKQVKGFICEAEGIKTAIDISAFGGWRSYLSASNR
jgi:allophanate hydrolase